MTHTDLTLQQILLQLEKQAMELDRLRKQLVEKATEEIPSFCTLKKACELKGLNYKSLYHQKWQQPCCGTKQKKLNGNRVWSREEIIEWLKITDAELEGYAQKQGVDISSHFKDGKNV